MQPSVLARRWVALVGYVCFTIIGSAVIPQLYPPAKWYYCLVLFIISPLFSIINGYCTGGTASRGLSTDCLAHPLRARAMSGTRKAAPDP